MNLQTGKLKNICKSMAVCQYSVRGPELDLNELGQVAETVTA